MFILGINVLIFKREIIIEPRLKYTWALFFVERRRIVEEEWQQNDDIDTYEISNKGRVKNILTGHILKSQKDRHGDDVVHVYKQGKRYKKRIKRLVAETFIDKHIDDSYVDYIDPLKSDDKNSTDNLQICPKNHGKKIRVTETGEVFDSITECSKALGMSISTISKCTNYPFYNNRLGLHFESID